MISLWRSSITLGRNADVAARGEKRAERAADNAIARAEFTELALARERSKKFAPAMILTPNGCKLLPEGWEKHFESAWAEKKTEA